MRRDTFQPVLRRALRRFCLSRVSLTSQLAEKYGYASPQFLLLSKYNLYYAEDKQGQLLADRCAFIDFYPERL